MCILVRYDQYGCLSFGHSDENLSLTDLLGGVPRASVAVSLTDKFSDVELFGFVWVVLRVF